MSFEQISSSSFHMFTYARSEQWDLGPIYTVQNPSWSKFHLIQDVNMVNMPTGKLNSLHVSYLEFIRTPLFTWVQIRKVFTFVQLKSPWTKPPQDKIPPGQNPPGQNPPSIFYILLTVIYFINSSKWVSEWVRIECYVGTTWVETCQENKSDLPFSISALISVAFYKLFIKSWEVSTIKRC